MSAAGTARHLQARPGIITGAGDAVEAEFARDRWDAFVLGIPARRGHNLAWFTKIEQPWLREAVKAWCRFRLGAGYTFNTINSAGQHMGRFSTFLADRPMSTAPPGCPARCSRRSWCGWRPDRWGRRPGRARCAS